MQEWEISIRHGYEVHDDEHCPVLNTPDSPDDCRDGQCPAFEEQGVEIGRMTFYRIRLDQGMNAWWAMEEESQELYEIATVLLDQETGYFTDEVDQQLEYVGTDLLVMDRVVLDSEWRGRGLGSVLAAEAVNRLAPGCRAVACSPGISDHEDGWKPDEGEWNQVTAKIAAAWEKVGFTLFKDNVYLLSPATVVPEERRAALRTEFKSLCAAWRESALTAQDHPHA
ncbi:hypothetical protein ABZ896_12575 [Streptomyces sp. NPDC047072]|uniref:hypothetical protein n=1 Tax=Streptomyces sp. NPDC047072 TaxID=3154809 RepID=UPI0033EBB1D6